MCTSSQIWEVEKGIKILRRPYSKLVREPAQRFTRFSRWTCSLLVDLSGHIARDAFTSHSHSSWTLHVPGIGICGVHTQRHARRPSLDPYLLHPSLVALVTQGHEGSRLLGFGRKPYNYLSGKTPDTPSKPWANRKGFPDGEGRAQNDAEYNQSKRWILNANGNDTLTCCVCAIGRQRAVQSWDDSGNRDDKRLGYTFANKYVEVSPIIQMRVHLGDLSRDLASDTVRQNVNRTCRGMSHLIGPRIRRIMTDWHIQDCQADRPMHMPILWTSEERPCGSRSTLPITNVRPVQSLQRVNQRGSLPYMWCAWMSI